MQQCKSVNLGIIYLFHVFLGYVGNVNFCNFFIFFFLYFVFVFLFLQIRKYVKPFTVLNDVSTVLFH